LSDFSQAYAGLENTESDGELAVRNGPLHQSYQTEFLLELDPSGTSTAQWLTTQADALIPKSSGGVYLQHHYVATNPHPSDAKDLLFRADQDLIAYGPAHARYHGFFQRFAKKFSYYDIFLVDSKSGNIVYSVFKESDFGTSLLTGPYRNANIAQAFKLASNPSSADAT
jgi:methyl-accepting chemotaxis protein